MSGPDRTFESILVELIRGQPGKRVSFGTFMEWALYHTAGGYYQQTREKIGKQGDFYTSASLGGIMGEVLAAAFLRRHSGLEHPLVIVEWGAGNGKMAAVILETIRKKAPEIYAQMRYELVEISLDHQGRQREALAGHEAVYEQFTPEQWWINGTARHVIVWANELLDAFPVERIRCREGCYEQAYVRWDAGRQQFDWIWLEAADGLMTLLDQDYVTLAEGQIADVSPAALAWYSRLLDRLDQSAVLQIDYGHETDELFASHRMNGSLIAYYKHQALDEPLLRPGEQDLTAMVHFSAFQRTAVVAGWEVLPLVTQRTFLEQEGILDLLQENSSGHPFDPVGRRNRSIRQLLWSDQMGDVFKVMEHRNHFGQPFKTR